MVKENNVKSSMIDMKAKDHIKLKYVVSKV